MEQYVLQTFGPPFATVWGVGWLYIGQAVALPTIPDPKTKILLIS